MEYIDLDWLMEYERCYAFKTREDVRKMFKDAPIIDITFCKNCIYRKDTGACSLDNSIRKDNDFCSDGRYK